MTNQSTLAEAIKMVLPHVSRDTTLPSLNAIHIYPDAVAATDRYTMARVKIETGIKAGEVLAIPLSIAHLGIEAIDGRQLTLTMPRAIKRLGIKDMQWATVTCPDISGDLPEYLRLLDEFEPCEDGTAPTAHLISMEHLRKYSQRHFPNQGLRMYHAVKLESNKQGPLKPLRATMNAYPDFDSLIIPQRFGPTS